MLCKKPFNGFGCGQCTPCRINLRNIWSSRIMFEASLHGDVGFLTLTYDDEKLPVNKKGEGILDYKHLQKFWKRLRKKLPAGSVRYYAVGEYGDLTQRPHFHAALFGYGCAGKILRPETGLRCHCDRCEYVRTSWQHGNITVDELNDTTAGYIAGYVVKKMTAKDDPRLNGRPPEASRMSQGIARGMVSEIATALKSEFGHLAFQDFDVPISLNVGGKSRPLGRYIRKKIRQEIDLYKVDPLTGEISYGAGHETLQALKQKSDPEVSALQENLKSLPLMAPERSQIHQKIDNARIRSASRRKQRIKNLEAKHNIYKGTKKL